MTDSEFNTHSDLDDFFGPRKWDLANEPADKVLGVVVGGSLSKGLEVKLDRDTSTEETAVGRYVVVQGQSRRFFSMITDVMLDATDPRWAKIAPDMSDDFMRDVMIGTNTFGLLHVSPMLMLEEGATETKPVKTVPGHFARVVEATAEDVNKIFGEEQPGYFYVGEPLDMDGIRIYLNLKRLVERSSGVFGKSGTGKTFLTRMLLAGIIKENVAVNLVFDMHNEYGWKSQDEAKTEVKGLRQLFPSGKVAVVTLDPESSRRRGSKVDYDVTIGYDQLEPEDVAMLQSLMGLSDVQVGALYAIHRRLGRNWIARLLHDERPEEMQDMIDSGLIHEGTLGAIQRKLSMFQRFGFLRPSVQDNVVEKLLGFINQGVNVVLEFGRYGGSLEAYILVANYLTRRIHQAYVERKEAAQGGGRDEPKPLVITIEEAHKFLDPAIAVADDLRHHRARTAQVQRHAAHRRSAPQRHRSRSDVADRHARHVPARRRERHPRGLLRRLGRERTPQRAGEVGHPAAGADPGPRRADARRHPHARYHLGGVLRSARLHRRRSVAEEIGEESQGVGPG